MVLLCEAECNMSWHFSSAFTASNIEILQVSYVSMLVTPYWGACSKVAAREVELSPPSGVQSVYIITVHLCRRQIG